MVDDRVAEPASAACNTLLIQFARSPVVGRVKTRMIPHLSPQQACDLHEQLVLWTCHTLVEAKLGAVELAVAGDAGHPLFSRCLELGVSALTLQPGQDLGENMYSGIAAGLSRYDRVVLVGSDCPSLDAHYLASALRALDRAPLVLGPAADGGYVLIGARQITPALFEGIPWGTGTVYAETLARLRQAGWNWEALDVLQDIDRPRDLPHWQALGGTVDGFSR
jgi:rSAM/selenodomain-associated transferase 1